MSIEAALVDQVPSKVLIFDRLLDKLRGKSFDTNSLFASELLAIFLQSDVNRYEYLASIIAVNNSRTKLCGLKGIVVILEKLSVYRKRDPEEPDEIEMLENLFDCLASVLMHPSGKTQFLEEEGPELMLMMLK